MKAHHIVFTQKEKAELLDLPLADELTGSQMLVKNHFDLISAGTELANYHGMPNTNGGGPDTVGG